MKCPKCRTDLPEDANFCLKCGRVLAEVAEGRTVDGLFKGERKHATVLFADLSGYTAMTERIDPEEVKEIMGRIFAEIARVVEKYDGLIERFFGDEVMALFGVPRAHEDDPVRAITAAMEIHKLVRNMSPEFEGRTGQPLSMHMGINTGLLVTGDEYIGKGRHGLTGDTINLAARLTKLAQAGEVLVGPDTYRLAEGYFAFEGLEPTSVKGKTEPVQIYRVLSAKEKPRKVHRLHGLRADLIGREAEMAQLTEAVHGLTNGEGSVVAILGGAGTGKSRLVEEFKTTLDLKKVQWREGHSYAYCQNVPYYPVIDMLNRTWHIEEGDPPEAVKDKVESGISYLLGHDDDIVPYVGSLYSISYPELEQASPEYWKARLHDAIHRILSAVVQRGPTVICLEDLHWADPSSLELLRFILSASVSPALFLCVLRPYFDLPASLQLNVSEDSYWEIKIEDLSLSEAQNMTESLLKTRTIPLELEQLIQEKAEGNPFYLEEVINALIESDTLVRDNGSWRLAKSISASDVPPTVHGVVSGRLDRLDSITRRTLQDASVMGRAFHREILKRVTDSEDSLDQSLRTLEEMDLIRMTTAHPDVEYVFKHVLTQEVVYNGLLKRDRRARHERIARVMEDFFQDRLTESYETLAFHFTKGQSLDKAVDYLTKAGEKSLKRYALEEAHQFYKEAFEILTTHSDDFVEAEKLLVDLLFKWALVFYYLGNFGGLTDLCLKHKSLADSLDDMARKGMFYAWLGFALYARSNYKDSLSYLETALRIGEEIQDQETIGHACAWLSYNYGDMGRFEDAIQFARRAQKTSRLIDSDYLFFKPLGAIGLACFFMGNPGRAFEAGQESLEFGRKHNNSRSLVLGHLCVAAGHCTIGDLPAAIERVKRAIEASADPLYNQMSKYYLALIYVQSFRFDEAESLLREVLSYTENLGTEWMETPSSLLLGAVLMTKGHMNQGLKMVEEARTRFETDGRQSFLALTEYILGGVYLGLVQRDAQISLPLLVKNISFLLRNLPFAGKKGELHFTRSIDIAREIGAKSIEGQACQDLGLLHKAKGRMNQARASISKAIELFEQSQAEVYLKQAREALASLR